LWAIIILASLIILFILALSVPLDFVFDINTNKSPRFSFRLLWFFGLVDTDLKKPKSKPEQKKKAIGKKPKKRRGPKAGAIYRILQIDKLFSHVVRLLRGILNSFNIKELSANIRVGFDNPADTGWLFAVAAPTNFLFSYLPYDINFQPSFNNETILEGNLSGDIRLKPLKLISPIAGFVFSLQSIRILKILISEWKRKK
jgi:hypothetical protein